MLPILSYERSFAWFVRTPPLIPLGYARAHTNFVVFHDMTLLYVVPGGTSISLCLSHGMHAPA